MKALNEKVWHLDSNAWGTTVGTFWQEFEIEESDVGTSRPNYVGFNRPAITFLNGDVGRQITVYTDNSHWTCWAWSTARRKVA